MRQDLLRLWFDARLPRWGRRTREMLEADAQRRQAAARANRSAAAQE